MYIIWHLTTYLFNLPLARAALKGFLAHLTEDALVMDPGPELAWTPLNVFLLSSKKTLFDNLFV